MTDIFTRVKPGDLITSDLFNQITDTIEGMYEITSVMEIKNNSEADASELGLALKATSALGQRFTIMKNWKLNGTVKVETMASYCF